MPTTSLTVEPDRLLPDDADRATLVGRVWDPELGGPCVVVVDGAEVVDVTGADPALVLVSRLADADDPVAVCRGAAARDEARRWSIVELVEAARDHRTDRPRLLSPIDLQVVKACGVTFVASMLERVIEERAAGDPARAVAVRDQLSDALGGTLSSVVPGSAEARQAKQILIDEGLWSQYLEVGIGPDPEVFTKAPVLSTVGCGATVGVRSTSAWNNPEPEVALLVSSAGRPVGATLANDVNLRDVEGRSALLLGEAKDNNASCSVGPFVRLFDDHFGLDEVRAMEVALEVHGTDGFTLTGSSNLALISRDPAELVGHVLGDHHQYPDGFLLLTGTMFAPTQDRDQPGGGFTHHRGDVVSISTRELGTLVNAVDHSETAPPWSFGVWDLMTNLAGRGLLPTGTAGARTGVSATP